MDTPILSLLIFIPIVGAVVVYLLGRFRERLCEVASLTLTVVVLALSLYLYSSIFTSNQGASFTFIEGPYHWLGGFGVDYYLGVDGLSASLILISAFLSVLVVLGSWDLITEKKPIYYFLILLFEGSIIGVFCSLNLILFYVFWEIVLIPMFFFIGVWGGPRRKYAAMKFLIFTYVGSVIMLLGFILIYLFTAPNTFNIPELAGKIPFWVQLLATVATFVGFGVKLPVVPFHTWLPDAHVEAPAPISVFLAGLLLKMGGYGFIRVNLGLLADASRQYAWVFIIFGILTMFYGALVAMIQRDLKRMIALTSINHMGFVLLGSFAGISASTAQGAIYGISGAIFQMFNHAAAIGILFMLSGYIHEQVGTRNIDELKGLRSGMPKTALTLILGSLAGMSVPMYSSFLSEWMVILSAISVNTWYALAVLIPLLTVAYFLWMIKRTVLSPLPQHTHYHDLPNRAMFALLLYLVPLFLLLVFPSLILGVVDPLSSALFQAVGGGG
ncbi:MAG: NADH-quinone oxidoreductase subunit M [Nitrososphaerales archaeon]